MTKLYVLKTALSHSPNFQDTYWETELWHHRYPSLDQLPELNLENIEIVQYYVKFMISH